MEYVGEESNSKPEHDCNTYDEGALLERGSRKNATIKHENRKLDQGNSERVLELSGKLLKLDGALLWAHTVTRPDIMSFSNTEIRDGPCPKSRFVAVESPMPPTSTPVQVNKQEMRFR